jgi:hypothetical protein
MKEGETEDILKILVRPKQAPPLSLYTLSPLSLPIHLEAIFVCLLSAGPVAPGPPSLIYIEKHTVHESSNFVPARPPSMNDFPIPMVFHRRPS